MTVLPITLRKSSLLIVIAVFLFISCSGTSKQNELDSDHFQTKQERIHALKQEIKYPSDFEDAAFELFNANGFSNTRTTVPGASSWDYKLVIKTAPANVGKWTQGMELGIFKEEGREWMKEIIKKSKNNWQTHSQPELYIRPNQHVEVIIFRTEGIIYKRIITL